MLLADFIAENQFLQILLFEFTIVVSQGYMRAFQMSNFKNKNCSELLLTNGMGLDGAPIKFLTMKISPLKVRPPSVICLFHKAIIQTQVFIFKSIFHFHNVNFAVLGLMVPSN